MHPCERARGEMDKPQRLSDATSLRGLTAFEG
jgi:hypothetical protein